MDFGLLKEILFFPKKEDNEDSYDARTLWGDFNNEDRERIFKKVRELRKVVSSSVKHIMFSYKKMHSLCFFEKEKNMEYYRVIMFPVEKMRSVIIDFKEIFGGSFSESMVYKFLNNRVLFSFKKYSVLSLPPTILSNEEIIEEKDVINNPQEVLNRIISKDWKTPNELFTRIYEVIRILSVEREFGIAQEFVGLLISAANDGELKDYLIVLKLFIEYLVGNEEKARENLKLLENISGIPDANVLIGLYYEDLIEPIKAINVFNHFLSLHDRRVAPFLNFVSMIGLAKTYYRMKKIDLTIRYLVLAENVRPINLIIFSTIVSSLLERLLLSYIDSTEFLVSNYVFDPLESKNVAFTVYNMVLTILQYIGKLEVGKQRNIMARLKTSLKILSSMFQLAGKPVEVVEKIRDCINASNNIIRVQCLNSHFVGIRRKKINSITIVLNDGRILWEKRLDNRPQSGYEELLSGALSAIAGIIEEASGEGPQEIVIPTGGKMFVLAISEPFILIVEGQAFEKDIREFARNFLSVVRYYIPTEISTQWTGNVDELVLPENTILTMIKDFEEE